jgi:hypothetical protein
MAITQSFDDRPARGPAFSGQVRSTVSILAILAAIGSFVLAAKDHGFLGLLAALVAIGAGLIGGVKSLSPRVSGGLISIFAVLLGVIAIVFSLLAIVVF